MKKCIVFLFAICILLSSASPAFATDAEILSAPARTLSEVEKDSWAQALKLELVDNDDYKTGLCAFAVSQDGAVAVATEKGRIYVYDSQGVFWYGYSFKPGSNRGVMFAGKNIAIYDHKGNGYIIYDPNGNCILAKDVTYLDPNLDAQFRFRTTIQQEGKTYTMERDAFFTTTYARLVITDADGNRNVIYDISTQHRIGAILKFTAFMGILALIFVCIYKQSKKVETWDGVWYCEELKMQISLVDYQNAFFMDDGEKIQCKCYLSNLGDALEVFCNEREHSRYRFGKTIFVAEIKQYEDMLMRVIEKESRREYTFVRTDKIG